MKVRLSATLWLAIAFVLLDCALAFADDDWSFSRSRRHSRGPSGPMSSESLAMGLAMVGVAFGVVCTALVFLHTWLFTSLVAAKALAALAVFSFLSWPLFILALFPPAVVFSLWVPFHADMASRNPNSALFMTVALAFAVILYCYLLNMLLAAFSPAPWGRRMTYAFAVLAVVGGIAGSIAMASVLPFLLFVLYAFCVWLAWQVYRKSAARVEARKHRAAEAG